MLDTPTLITIGLAVGVPALGLARAWGALGVRIRLLEARAVEQAALRVALDAAEAKIETVRNKQGERIGVAEGDIAVVRGQIDVLKGLLRRSRTAAHGTAPGHAPHAGKGADE
jgi:hypothetical protein